MTGKQFLIGIILLLLLVCLFIQGIIGIRKVEQENKDKAVAQNQYKVPAQYVPHEHSGVQAECLGGMLFYITKNYYNIVQVYTYNHVSTVFPVKCELVTSTTSTTSTP